MTPHDRWLEPDDDPEPATEECETCDGSGWVDAHHDNYGHCSDCGGTGEIILTDAERQQKAFDDFDPPEPEFGE
jgi:DnaJ-class molecular chaperone